MANWKKVVVSGSSAELSALAVDGTITANAFSGDGSSLTGVQASGLNIEGFTNGTSITVAATDKLLLSDDGTEKYINVSQLGGTLVTTSAVTSAGALMDSEVDADIKTLSLPANTTISTFGASLVDDADASTARTTLGLGTAATTAATAYATAAQGTKADTALQTLGSVTASTNATAYATAAQGTKADTALQTLGSVTGHSDVTSAGSGAIITSTERTKLNGIAASADNYGSFNIGDAALNADVTSGEKVVFRGSGATDVSFDTATQTFTISSTDTNTNTTYSAGNGIALTGTTFSVAGGDGLTQNASGLAVDSTVLRTTGDSVISGSAQVAMTGDVTGTAAATTVGKVQGVALTSQEMTQVANIGSTTISSTQWGYVGNANQNVRTTDSPTFVGGTFTGDVSVAGDLVVQGDLTSLQTTNLNIEDQFILINSGSDSAKDAGFIFANRAGGTGQAFFYDTESNRPSWATEVAWNATAVDPTAYIARVFDTDAAQTPVDERGSIKVTGDDVFIYV
jgi:trimeric autotransporter adhesin